MRREALEFVNELGNMPNALKLLHADKIEKRDKIARKALKLKRKSQQWLSISDCWPLGTFQG